MSLNWALTPPLPFVSAVIALVIAAHIVTGGRGSRASRACFSALCLLFAIEAVLVGLRFGYGIERLIPLQRVLALGVGPLLWCGFRALADEPPQGSRVFAHLGGAILLAAAATIVDQLGRMIDLIIAASYGAYLWGLVRLWRGGTGLLAHTAFNRLAALRRRLLLAIVLLAALLALDTAIAIDFAIWNGRHAPVLIMAANLGLIVAAVAVAFRAPVEGHPSAAGPSMQQTATAADHILAKRTSALLSETGLHRDPDLTLSRLARRLGVPARSLSLAINRVYGLSVSLFINERRVEDAAALLKETDATVADIMEQTGFLSRSNFYREFQRVHSTPPAEFRKQNAINEVDFPTT